MTTTTDIICNGILSTHDDFVFDLFRSNVATTTQKESGDSIQDFGIYKNNVGTRQYTKNWK